MPENTYNELIQDMRKAISANINYLRNNGNSQVRIKNGKFTSVADEQYLYEFELDYLQDLEPSSEIEVKIGQKSNSGKVVAIKNNIVTLAIDAHLGETVASATLIISSYYLLEKLNEHLQNIHDDNAKHTALGQKVFGLQSSQLSSDETYKSNPLLKIDKYQEIAIKSALGSEVTYIWGPPGTGKSETISNLLENLLERKLSVLLIAHTNAATDSVLEKIVELMEKQKNRIYEDGKILRVGNYKSIAPALMSKKVVPEVIVAEKAKPIIDEIEKLRHEEETLGNQLDSMLRAERLFKEQDEKQELIDRYETYIKEQKETFELQANEYKSVSNSLNHIEAEIAAFQSKGKISQLMSGTNIQRITSNQVSLLQEKKNLNASILKIKENVEAARANQNTAKLDLQQLQDNIEKLDVKFDRNEIESVRKKLLNVAERISALEIQLNSLEEQLFAQAQVIATTLTKTYMHNPILERQFDCVILDEASMAPLPAVLSVSGLASKKVVLVGDFLQLPPIVKHQVDRRKMSDKDANEEERLVKQWLSRDIFAAVGIEATVRNGTQPEKWLKMLKQQYRMHPDISSLINKLVYAKKSTKYELKNGDPVLERGNERLDREPLKNSHVGIYDTSSVGSIPLKSESGSTYNLTHALIAVELAKKAIKSGYEEIGIISSYRAQVNLIKKIVKDSFSKNDKDAEKIIVDTVHKFQGGARDIIIFDVTTPYTNTMFDDGKEDGDDAKLINVAFSRAKEKLILLADVKVVTAKHSSTSLIKKTLQLCSESKKPFIDAGEVLNEYKADDRTEVWLEKLTKTNDVTKDIEDSKLFDELDFYPQFQRDLLNAKQEIIIQSAFLTENRFNHLKQILDHVIKKGVRVFVSTRVTYEHDGNMQKQSELVIKEMEKLGVIVLTFNGKIHQKFATIDRKVMWEGSLNILSYRDSKEVMRRFIGKSTISQFLEFMKFDKNIGELGENNLKHCEVCKSKSAWLWTKKGSFGRPYTICLYGNHVQGKPPQTDKDRDDRKKANLDKRATSAKIREKIKLNSKNELVCPVHNRILIEKMGRFGKYWECPNVKDCQCKAADTFKQNLIKGKK
jgi:nucleoside-triphosphatase THEP1